eukprot:4444669-Amphidinium_carterae.1
MMNSSILLQAKEAPRAAGAIAIKAQMHKHHGFTAQPDTDTVQPNHLKVVKDTGFSVQCSTSRERKNLGEMRCGSEGGFTAVSGRPAGRARVVTCTSVHVRSAGRWMPMSLSLDAP